MRKSLLSSLLASMCIILACEEPTVEPGEVKEYVGFTETFVNATGTVYNHEVDPVLSRRGYSHSYRKGHELRFSPNLYNLPPYCKFSIKPPEAHESLYVDNLNMEDYLKLNVYFWRRPKDGDFGLQKEDIGKEIGLAITCDWAPAQSVPDTSNKDSLFEAATVHFIDNDAGLGGFATVNNTWSRWLHEGRIWWLETDSIFLTIDDGQNMEEEHNAYQRIKLSYEGLKVRHKTHGSGTVSGSFDVKLYKEFRN